jgi:hypothetical protein
MGNYQKYLDTKKFHTVDAVCEIICAEKDIDITRGNFRERWGSRRERAKIYHDIDQQFAWAKVNRQLLSQEEGDDTAYRLRDLSLLS